MVLLSGPSLRHRKAKVKFLAYHSSLPEKFGENFPLFAIFIARFPPRFSITSRDNDSSAFRSIAPAAVGFIAYNGPWLALKNAKLGHPRFSAI
jgi:hypothetical protein